MTDALKKISDLLLDEEIENAMEEEEEFELNYGELTNLLMELTNSLTAIEDFQELPGMDEFEVLDFWELETYIDGRIARTTDKMEYMKLELVKWLIERCC